MVKLVAVDMDGTFLSSQKTYDKKRFEQIFAELNQRGIKFVVASGNQYAQLASFFPEIREEITFVAENGVLIIDQGKLIHENHFNPQTVQRIIQFLRKEHPDVNMVLNGIKSAYIERTQPEAFQEFVAFYCHALEKVDDLLALDFENERYVKFALGVPEARTEEIAQAISDAFPEEARAVSSGHGSVDIILAGKDKANALQVLADLWEIHPSEMLAFGDGHNDLEMLRYVGHSYAMANGAPAVKEVAKAIAPLNDESGVLQVLEEYFA
ncbi:HAD family hydrolase [Enterococcus saccharolyticus]|uniref:Cof-type HAD-IIB family hydrolase n=1 Tax=Enterococcus saccharolyticus TaxID=41997 RepID=UPI001E49C269|nr:Cof-type HAD-IIB family hydrolase [Enterococcus saccharolyticus]MCD5002054.1 HAD family hydrolase [Enterococcus saccharolyticus]